MEHIQDTIRHEDDAHVVTILSYGQGPAGLELTLEIEYKDGSPVYVKAYMGVPPSADTTFSASIRSTLIEKGCTETIADRVITDLGIMMRREALHMPQTDLNDMRN